MVQLYVHMSPNKLWRSYSIFNLCPRSFWSAFPVQSGSLEGRFSGQCHEMDIIFESLHILISIFCVCGVGFKVFQRQYPVLLYNYQLFICFIDKEKNKFKIHQMNRKYLFNTKSLPKKYRSSDTIALTLMFIYCKGGNWLFLSFCNWYCWTIYLIFLYTIY